MDLQQLLRRQQYVVARRQLLELGVDRHYVRNQVRAGRWVLRTPLVVSATTGPLSRGQQLWLGLLHAGPGAAVGGLTAAAAHGLRGWDRREICILVDDDDAVVRPVPGYAFVRTRRPIGDFVQPGSPARVCRVEPAVLLFAAYTRSPRTASGLLAAAVQQRLTSPYELARWVEAMRPLRRAREFRTVLADIEGGAQSLGELDVGRFCRRFGLPQPRRQVRRPGPDGRLRFTDCEWALPDGRTVVLEVDGAFHLDVASWESDMVRERSLVVEGAVVLRCTTAELRRDPGRVVGDLLALGVPGRGSQRAG